MKKLYIIIISTLLCVAASAQPDWAKNATKSVFTLKTFDAEGTLIGSSNGFYVSSQGEAISSFTPFRKASKAIVIDNQGKEWPVVHLLGVDDTYDVAKFKVAVKKAQPLTIANENAADSSDIYILPYSTSKKPQPAKGIITKNEIFKSEYAYYTINQDPSTDNGLSAPVLNSNGEVIGILQQATDPEQKVVYAVSAKYANSLKVNGLSINDPALKSSQIKKALPDEEEQAILTMFFASSSLDSLAYCEIVEDFINKFPNSPEGYTHRAQIKCDANLFDEADEDMNKAISVAQKKDEAHYSYARMIFGKELYKSNMPYDKWSKGKAISETDMAYSINPLPIYKQFKAQITFSLGKYKEACDIYKQLTDSGFNKAELFIEQAKCYEQLKDTASMVAMVDSAVNTFSKPYLKEAAPFILIRAQTLANVGQYRKAALDFGEYEKLMRGSLNAQFYYIKYQTELNGKLYQQAMNDITKAIEYAPNNAVFYAEKASLEIRVNYIDEALLTASKCISIAPEYSDGYLFLGLAQCLKGNKTEGIKNLTKAKELGDEQAASLIEKYGK